MYRFPCEIAGQEMTELLLHDSTLWTFCPPLEGVHCCCLVLLSWPAPASTQDDFRPQTLPSEGLVERAVVCSRGGKQRWIAASSVRPTQLQYMEAGRRWAMSGRRHCYCYKCDIFWFPEVNPRRYNWQKVSIGSVNGYWHTGSDNGLAQNRR